MEHSTFGPPALQWTKSSGGMKGGGITCCSLSLNFSLPSRPVASSLLPVQERLLLSDGVSVEPQLFLARDQARVRLTVPTLRYFSPPNPPSPPPQLGPLVFLVPPREARSPRDSGGERHSSSSSNRTFSPTPSTTQHATHTLPRLPGLRRSHSSAPAAFARLSV